MVPYTVPLDQVSVLTSGAIALRPTILPADIDTPGTGSIDCLVTLDDAITGAITGRWGIIGEG